MNKGEKYFRSSEGFDPEGASLLSILSEAVAYSSPVSPETGFRFNKIRARTASAENVEIGYGLYIKVNGLSQPSSRTRIQKPAGKSG